MVGLRIPLFGLASLTLALLLGGLVDPDAARLVRSEPYLPPTAQHWLGTNGNGQDIFWRMLVGGLHTLSVALPAALAALALGTLLGVLAGYRRGLTDLGCRWVADGIDALPFFLWVGVLVVALRPSPLAVPLAIAGAFWTRCFRTVRAEAVRLGEAGHVQAARLLGVPRARLLLEHLLPPIGYLGMTQGTILVAAAVKVEVTVSFLGLSGADSVSWGVMLAEAAEDLHMGHPWNAIAAGGAVLCLLVLLTSLTERLQLRWRERTDADTAR